MRKIKIVLAVITSILGIAFIWIISNTQKIKKLRKDKFLNSNLSIFSASQTTSNQTIQQTGSEFLLKEITSNYSVLASDQNKRLFVTSAVSLNFTIDGSYNVVVRAYPVSIKQGTTLIQDLDAGDYLIKVSSGIVTIIS
jgi:hypothetical protein